MTTSHHPVELAVQPPRPLLSTRAEAHLSGRQREILDQLETLILGEGFASFTVRELAARAGCSLRTIYELAPSKQELVLVVLDRFLHRVGRSALDAIRSDARAVDQIRAYLTGGSELQRRTVALSEDIADEPGAARLLDRHFTYVTAVVEHLIESGVTRGELREVDPRVAGAVIAGGVLFLSRPEVAEHLGRSGEPVTDEALDLLLRGLVR